MIDLAAHRLISQQLARQAFERPQDVVAYFGALQAQDYTAAKWAVSQRTIGAADSDVEQAYTDGSILRTHLMRPTWHFVAPADIRWILALTAGRVKAGSAARCRELGLDDETFSRSGAAIARALEDGRECTRAEIVEILEQAGINTEGQRIAYLLMFAELDGLICSGARRGKQITYALLDSRAPQANPFTREEALAELARRYFTAHGPASLKDFVWWSGLTAADAKAGIEMARPHLQRIDVDSAKYWFGEPAHPSQAPSEDARILSAYDEFTVGYTDRSHLHDPLYADTLNARESHILSYVMVSGSQIIGHWKRTFERGSVAITWMPLRPLSAAEEAAFAVQARRYAAFLGMPLILK